MSELPKWPVKADFSEPTPYGHAMTAVQGWDFETARAEAAIARLRVAAETLRSEKDRCPACLGVGKVISWDMNGGPPLVKCDRCADLRSAIVAIGIP